MFGQNPKLPPEKGDGRYLNVHTIFYTIQGEATHIGRPAVFLRLYGCNLACIFCDTDFDTYETLSCEQILAKINEVCTFKGNSKILVVISGGEPFRQRLAPICELLLKNNFVVQIETNGLLYNAIPEEVEVICSPKNTGSGYHNIRPDVLKHAVGVKFIVSKFIEGYDDIAEVGQTAFNIPVYIQPMDEYDDVKNRANSDLAIRLTQKHNARFSIQLHKVIGIA